MTTGKSQQDGVKFVESEAHTFKNDRPFADLLTRTDPVLKQDVTEADTLRKRVE